MLYVINYADGEPYESYRKINTKTAYKFGKADVVLEYSSIDVPQSYKNLHKEIFEYKRGAGLWLWKPYIINKALSELEEGAWLFYSDAGATFIRDIHHIIKCANENKIDIVTFEQPMLCRQFTKHECYIVMGVEDHNENQALGFLLLRKSKESVRFVSEWLHYCENEELLSPNYFHKDIKEWDDFYAHREDQSILSLLRTKWGLPAFRDPSDYGEMPFMYDSGKWLYNPLKYRNSNYPTVLLCNRKVSPYYYAFKFLIKKLLLSVGISLNRKK